MWYVFSIPEPCNKEKKWDLLLPQYRFALDYMKLHVESLQKVSEEDQYMVHNLTWSGVYLSSTLSNTILHKVLTLLPLAATGSELFFATMTTLISDSCYYLKETLTHTNSIKLKIYPGKNVTNLCAAILVDTERLESAGAFNTEHLGYRTCVYEDTS